jgi:hypothetical protein
MICDASVKSSKPSERKLSASIRSAAASFASFSDNVRLPASTCARNVSSLQAVASAEAQEGEQNRPPLFVSQSSSTVPFVPPSPLLHLR